MSLHHSATHRGAPFVGRRREIGLLIRLIEDGLGSSCPLVAVAGEVGAGRRRLLQEALRRGPQAEWVHLAPGDVSVDVERWVRTELGDLLEAHPDAPYPDWALHVLARWLPELRGRARFRRGVPRSAVETHPERVGSAVGAVLRALTGEVPVLVDVGVWPRRGTALRLVQALTRALAHPGTLVLAAVDAQVTVPADARVLNLDALKPREVEELLSAWSELRGNSRAARWLHRVTGGHAFHLHETVRWLEESGHARVDDEHARVRFDDDTHHYLVPFNLDAVLEARYLRLPLESKQLLHLLAQHDGMLTMEALRARFHPDELVFEAALTPLRRRGFLLQRTFRRPVALSSPLWGTFVMQMVERFTRYRWKAPKRASRSAPPVEMSPAAEWIRRLGEVGRGDAEDAHRATLAAGWRAARRRPGLPWVVVRGRLAVLSARELVARGRWAACEARCRRGLAALPEALFPALRLRLMAMQSEALVGLARFEDAQSVREEAVHAARLAGHLEAAARLAAVCAEGARRLGQLAHAEATARDAATELTEQGQSHHAALARYTQARACCDAGRLAEAAALVSRYALDAPLHDVAARLQAGGVLPAEETHMPTGWGWGLDAPAQEGSDLPAQLDHWELRCAQHHDDPSELADAFQHTADLCHRMNASDRLRRIAEANIDLPLGMSATYDRVYRPLLMRGVRRTMLPEPELVRLFLCGRVRVEHDGVERPGGLWPEWIRTLLGATISGELLNQPLSLAEANTLLAHAGDAPNESLADTLRRATAYLLGAATAIGGFEIVEDTVRFSWHGVTCDVLTDEPGDGVYLPGDESERAAQVRAWLRDRGMRERETDAREHGPTHVAE